MFCNSMIPLSPLPKNSKVEPVGQGFIGGWTSSSHTIRLGRGPVPVFLMCTVLGNQTDAVKIPCCVRNLDYRNDDRPTGALCVWVALNTFSEQCLPELDELSELFEHKRVELL